MISDEFYERLAAEKEAEIARLKTCGVIEMMLVNVNIDSFVRDKESEISRLITRLDAEASVQRERASGLEMACEGLEKERDRLKERLDQYEAYAITVKSALDDRDENRRLYDALNECEALEMTHGAVLERLTRVLERLTRERDDARLLAAAIVQTSVGFTGSFVLSREVVVAVDPEMLLEIHHPDGSIEYSMRSGK